MLKERYCLGGGRVRNSKKTHFIPSILRFSEAHSVFLDQIIVGCFSIACMEETDTRTLQDLLSHLNKRRSGVQLNTLIFNQFLQTYRMARKTKKGIELLKMLDVHGVSLNVVSFRILLSGCIEERLLHMGLKVQEYFVKSGIKMDGSVFSLVLKLLSHIRKD
eukprot:TRINITY_DN7904_c0_g1_i1.p1 TRINITY_DN7904_c0_g1~~TRINITY_DN7904_c0_g1_i1.p1  ORF type:complete len:162 (+),score=39.06 TRINITY_DN7904_c0_g1_i1:142-627(+)